VFYGPKLQVAEITEMGYDASARDLGVSLPAINKLIAQSATTGPITLLTASSTSLPLVRRAQSELALVTAPPADFKLYLDNLKIYLDNAERALVAEPRRVGGARPDEQVPDVRTLRDNANQLTSQVLVPQINRSAASRMLKDIALGTPALKPVHQLLLDLREIGADTSDRERFIYGGHAYAIVGAQIMIDGRAATAPVEQRHLAQLNVDTSNVTLRNPHHGNVPTESEGQGQSPGQFRLTLREFLRHFAQLDSGEVERRR
jgi:hypothetical protein